jgi:hypothetical protein
MNTEFKIVLVSAFVLLSAAAALVYFYYIQEKYYNIILPISIMAITIAWTRIEKNKKQSV